MVRAATLEDAAAIAAVHVATWRTAYRGLLPDEFLKSLGEAGYEERWRRSLAEGASRVYVVEEDGRVVGFASGGRERAGEDGYAGELYALYVMQDAQRRGNGHALVRAVARGLREMGLEDMIVWVLRDNPTARNFYERLGGVYVRSQPITSRGAGMPEGSCGWRRQEGEVTEGGAAGAVRRRSRPECRPRR